MIRKKNDLKYLVDSLSGAEKRYFRNFSKAFIASGESPLFLQLFDVLETEKVRVQSLPAGFSSKSLADTKRRLYENILSSQRMFHRDKHAGIVIMNLLAEVQILYHQGLGLQALFQLRKAFALSQAHERFDLQLQALEWESVLQVIIEDQTRTQDEILKEETVVLEKQMQFALLKTLYGKAETMKRKYGFLKGDLLKVMDREILKAPGMPLLKNCLSKKAAYYHHFIHALCAWMSFEHRKAYTYSQKLLFPESISIAPGDYINGLLEHVTCCVCMFKFEQALAGLEIGMAAIEEKGLSQSAAYTARMFAYQATYKLIIYTYQGDRYQLIQQIRRTEEQMKGYEQPLPFERMQVILGNLMNAYMAIGEMDKADDLWTKMFNKHAREVRKDIYSDLYLFRLFSLLQQSQYALIRSAALSAVRYYKKSPRSQFELELPIALLLQKDTDWTIASNRRKVLSEVKSEIALYIKKISPKTLFQEHYTRYLIWTETLLKGKPYCEEAADWYRSHYNRKPDQEAIKPKKSL